MPRIYRYRRNEQPVHVGTFRRRHSFSNIVTAKSAVTAKERIRDHSLDSTSQLARRKGGSCALVREELRLEVR